MGKATGSDAIDGEFRGIRSKLLGELAALIPASPPELRRQLCADLERLHDDPELRAAFVRGVFAGDPTLPGVWNIRARLRGRR
jgi:hypothetical protein